jgi:hypothetical protein
VGSLSLLREATAEETKGAPKAAEHTLTVIAGKPRDRGRRYGQTFKDGIHAFLDKEIYRAFTQKPSPREEMLRYADGCARAVREYLPALYDELEGMAEGTGLRLEELVLITLHEELYHKGVLPKVEHCTAVAVGPPDTRDGHTYVGQTWDWMQSVYGLSSMLLWQRPEGPSLLAYAYPGLWVGAGLNSAGLALCWTSASGKKRPGPRVGIPSYVLLTQLLYQDTLEGALAEARRLPQAGWFTFVLADDKGQLANLEGAPDELAVELHQGRLARVDYGSRQMTGTAAGAEVKYHARCRHTYELLAAAKGQLDGGRLQDYFGDLKAGICNRTGTIDMMVFDTTAREAVVSRGPGYAPPRWKRFTFGSQS